MSPSSASSAPANATGSASAPAVAGAAFPAGFVWGAATAAYQVEGAAGEDGRGRSVWDTFTAEAGRVKNGDTGNVAADQYHLYKQDVALMKRLGLMSYRFSVSWPRVLPAGTGQVNQKGLDYYRRLVDELNNNGIAPMATLWHWDTPQALQDTGGWESRDTALAFADYAEIVYAALGADVPTYLTLNEPKTLVGVGYLYGTHAPGKQDLSASTRVAHHLLLGHGLAVEAFRASGVQSQIGPALNLSPVYPADEADTSPEAMKAVHDQDIWENRLYLDPIFTGAYPDEGLADVIDLPALEAVVQDGDLTTISGPVDLLAVNYYNPAFVGPGREVVHKHPIALPTFWLEIFPRGLQDILVRVDRDYGQPRMIVTENGRPTETEQSADGTFADDDRIEYVRDHLLAAHAAIEQGVKLEGYQLWSLIDNFEWEQGYAQRFGMVHVDFDSQVRTPKKSAHWYADVIKNNAVTD
ncbi:MAG: GH1 family beta-glucosidase [Mycobacteriales bacterium]